VVCYPLFYGTVFVAYNVSLGVYYCLTGCYYDLFFASCKGVFSTFLFSALAAGFAGYYSGIIELTDNFALLPNLLFA
jgi:hypothetical protein